VSGHRLWKPRRRGEGAATAAAAPDPNARPQTIDEAATAILHWLGRTTVYRSRHFVGELTVDIYPLTEPPKPAVLVQNSRHGTRSLEDAADVFGGFAGARDRRAVRVFIGDPGPDGKGKRMVMDAYPSKPHMHVAVHGAAFPADDWIYQFDIEVLDLNHRGQVD